MSDPRAAPNGWARRIGRCGSPRNTQPSWALPCQTIHQRCRVECLSLALPTAETATISTRMDSGTASIRSRSLTYRSIAGGVIASGALLLTLAPERSRPRTTTAGVIRGRVTDDSSRAIVATIVVTRGPDRLTRHATTDSAGNFRARFDKGTGDYLVYVSAPGFSPVRRRVQRQAHERDLLANFVLPRAVVATLDAVRIEGRKPVRASNPVGPTQLETGSSEEWRDEQVEMAVNSEPRVASSTRRASSARRPLARSASCPRPSSSVSSLRSASGSVPSCPSARGAS